MNGLVPQLLVHLYVTTLQVRLRVFLIQLDGAVTVCKSSFKVAKLVEGTCSIKVDGLIVAYVKRVKVETLGEQAGCHLEHIVLEGLCCTCFKVLRVC